MNLEDKVVAGDTVNHVVFGIGQVLRIHRERGYEVMDINFAIHGRRELVWEFAHSKMERQTKTTDNSRGMDSHEDRKGRPAR